jgi:hypothetical protein
MNFSFHSVDCSVFCCSFLLPPVLIYPIDSLDFSSLLHPLSSSFVFSTLLFPPLPFPSLLFSSLLFSSLPSSSLLFSSLLLSSLVFSSLVFSSLLFPPLLFSSLLFPSLLFPSLVFSCLLFYLIRITGGSLPKSYSDLFPDDSDNERNNTKKKEITDSGNPRTLPSKNNPKKDTSVKSPIIQVKNGGSNTVSGSTKNVENNKEIEKKKLDGIRAENRKTDSATDTKSKGKKKEVESSRDKSNERGKESGRDKVRDKEIIKGKETKRGNVKTISPNIMNINTNTNTNTDTYNATLKTNKPPRNESSSPSFKNDPQNALGSEYGPPMSPPRLTAPPLNKTRPPSFSQQNALEDGIDSLSLK